MNRVPELRGAHAPYVRLRLLSETTRYTHRFRPPPAVVQDALTVQLDTVRRTVLTALGLPA